ncbi:MAG: 1-acyl-sn-glycerol-3-phosphate acyltransferase [Desulfobacterales bacterium]|nr:MAG: 1-acyl-sn-glycerol-3-phosphate acyltransferase [Desulfobacterales bacterium]
MRMFRPVVDRFCFLICWAYYTLGFFFFFSPVYLAAALIARDRAAAFQSLNHWFYRGFFALIRLITPGIRFDIPEEVRRIRGSVIVCNHLSFLDPILLISLFSRHSTIVKAGLFRLPVFHHVVQTAGYLPSGTTGGLEPVMIRQMERLADLFAAGGNFFVFPEGTRSRDGRLNPFHKGAFKIARRAGRPLDILVIRNTGKFYPPGGCVFRTCRDITIRLERAGGFTAAEVKKTSLPELMAGAREIMERAAGIAD